MMLFYFFDYLEIMSLIVVFFDGSFIIVVKRDGSVVVLLIVGVREIGVFYRYGIGLVIGEIVLSVF